MQSFFRSHRLFAYAMTVLLTLLGTLGSSAVYARPDNARQSARFEQDIRTSQPTLAAATIQLGAASYLGGGATDYGEAVALDAQGNIYLAASTFSNSFVGQPINRQGGTDIVVAKLSPDMTTLQGFFTIGSTGEDHVSGMAVTPQGEVVLAVNVESDSFPTKNALRTTFEQYNSGVLLKINATLDDLVFSTYTDFKVILGTHTVALDGAGNISVAGYFSTTSPNRSDLILERFSPDGQQLLFRKVWNEDDAYEEVQRLIVRPDGTTYMAGSVGSPWGGFVVTDNAFQKTCGRRLALGEERGCDDDAFVMRLNAAGEVDYATYLGGNGSDEAIDMAVDAQGAMYVFGWAGAQDFPTTPNAAQPRCRAARPEDGCYYDMFVTKFAPEGDRLVYSTYLTSNDLSGLDFPKAIAVDAAGNATVVGFTASDQWPVKEAVQPALNAAPCPNAFQDRLCFDSVITSFEPDGQLAFSSYLGGKFDEYGNDVVLGVDGSIYVAGTSESLDFPTTTGVVQPSARSGTDAFVARLSSASTVPEPPPSPTPSPPPSPTPSPPPSSFRPRAYLSFLMR